MDIIIIETNISIKKRIDHWNMSTSVWLRKTYYEGLIDFGVKKNKA